MKSSGIKRIVYAALLAAVIFAGVLVTRIPIGSFGYFHLGDSLIFIGAAFLPMGDAAIAAALGASLADLCSGGALWIPFTVVIKALSVLCLTSKKDTFLCLRNYIAIPVLVLINVLGYYLAEVILVKSFASPLVSVPMNALQSVCSAAVFVVFGCLADKASLKKNLKR